MRKALDITKEDRVEEKIMQLIEVNFNDDNKFFHIEYEEGNEMYINKHFVIYYKSSTIGVPDFPRSGHFDYSITHTTVDYNGDEEEHVLFSRINSAIADLKKKVG